jgi:hypothetical protein
MNITRLITLTVILGIGLAMAPAANADKSHGPFAVRLGVGVPLDNNMRDWKDVDVISGFSYFINHSRGATTITGVDLDTQLHTKHGNSAHAMGVTYTVRKLMGDDTGSQNYVGLGLGIYRTEYKQFVDMSAAQSTSSTSTTGVTNFGGKAMIGRMDNKGHFVEAAYTYTGTSLSNGLSATFGLRF